MKEIRIFSPTLFIISVAPVQLLHFINKNLGAETPRPSNDYTTIIYGHTRIVIIACMGYSVNVLADI